MCSDCHSENTFFCDECGEYHLAKEVEEHDVEGDTMCDNCYRNVASECDKCGEKVRDENMKGAYCEECSQINEESTVGAN